jgi:ferredoxin
VTYNARVDRETCINSGLCVATAPHVFRLGDQDTAELVRDPPACADTELLRLARQCPSGAIELFVDGVQIDVFEGYIP